MRGKGEGFKPVSLEAAHSVCLDNSRQKPLTLCTLIAPLGMRRGKAGMSAKRGDGTK